MLNYLIKHALDNVWCVPMQDRQTILALQKSTPIGGARHFVDVPWNRIYLPDNKQYYHVYALGQNTPDRFNLGTDVSVWHRADTIGPKQNSLVEIYTTSGLRLSMASCWIMYGTNKMYYLAVQLQPLILDLDRTDIYCRLYSNAYYNSLRDTTEVNIETEALQFKIMQDFLEFQWRHLQTKERTYGLSYLIKNGYYVESVMPGQLKTGDYVDRIFDGSVKQVIDFKISDLPTFQSTLDSARKYLIHLPKGSESINYRDDLDIFIISKSGAIVTGKLYHKNHESAVRMVTHNDYSIPTNIVEAYIQSEPNWTVENLYFRIHIKHAGFVRPLVFEHNRILELYKLTDEQIVRAMVGLDANVPEFQAATLEASNYTKIMRSLNGQITQAMMSYAYGYNAMSKLVADTPQLVVGDHVVLPIGLQNHATVFEYDSQGLLLGWRHHIAGERYFTQYPECKLIEVMAGLGKRTTDIQIGNNPVQINKSESYRFYITPVGQNGQPLNKWHDVTGDTTKYTISPTGTVVWTLDNFAELAAVKGNSDFLCYDFTLPDNDALYKFSITFTELAGQVLHIPPGHLEIWMNGRSLIEGLDYYVEYPQVIICNKEYLRLGEQRFTVRGMGFCNSDMSRLVPTEIGFAQHGKLSVDRIYNLRDDRVVRIVADGCVYHRNELSFVEDSRLPTINIPNGRPYQVYNIDVPVRGLVDYDTYPLRDRSRITDSRVSDYMTLKLPEPIWPTPMMITDRYQLYSPFIAKILADLKAGYLNPPPTHFSDGEVDDWIRPYLYLLDYDPTYLGVDSNYVAIQPHQLTTVIMVTPEQYYILERLIKMYLNNKLDLTSHVGIQLD
jgi:hypothetical protein